MLEKLDFFTQLIIRECASTLPLRLFLASQQ